MSSTIGRPSRIDCVGGHESAEINVPLTVFSAAVLVASIVIACIVSQFVFSWLLHPLGERSATPINGSGLVAPLAPRLEGIEMMSGEELNGARIQASRQLQTYGWVDRDKGIIRVPIEKAMQIAIERNLLPSAAKTPNGGSDSNTSNPAPAGPKLNTP
jgi:hypothetical protein